MQIDVLRPAGANAGDSTPGENTLDWTSLGHEWRRLEAAADGSFFQSWTWLGCRIESRFTRPLVLRATLAGRVIGLALFNRTGPWFAPTLWLHETGRRAEDSVFIEHNGPLLARGHQDLLQPMLAEAARHGRLILNGVDDPVLQAVRLQARAQRGYCQVANSRLAPFLDLQDYVSEQSWLSSLSASTRYRLRRSQRAYQSHLAVGDALSVHKAADESEAQIFLEGLAALHQRSWIARGQSGAFAEPAFIAFHQELITRALPRGEVELLRISVTGHSNAEVIGYLYNFRWRDRIYAYQSGFDYETRHRHQLPGLTCHHFAIAAALSAGRKIYDFMAGESQYKSSLANTAMAMHWLVLTQRGTMRNLLHYSLDICGRIYSRRGYPLADEQHMPSHEAVTTAETRPARLDGRKVTQRLEWPLSASIIGILSIAAWVALAYAVRWVLQG